MDEVLWPDCLCLLFTCVCFLTMCVCLIACVWLFACLSACLLVCLFACVFRLLFFSAHVLIVCFSHLLFSCILIYFTFVCLFVCLIVCRCYTIVVVSVVAFLTVVISHCARCLCVWMCVRVCVFNVFLIEFARVFVIVCDRVCLLALLALTGSSSWARCKSILWQRRVYARGSGESRGDSAAARVSTNKNFWRARAGTCVYVSYCVHMSACKSFQHRNNG